ncbi:MAG: hypothetical protein Kow0092_14990 [Deferrisomatales bacterium]
MDFLRPALLWGLLSVAVPILLHLLGRRRARPVPIATLRFLERARARAAAHLKLRRLLLLAARVGILGCLVVVFAGPGCRRGGAPVVGPTSWVLVLDTSPSMAASRGGRTPLEEGRRALAAVLDQAGPEDRFLLATTRDGAEGWSQGFRDAEGARSVLARTGVEYGTHRVDRALERAWALLEGAQGGRIVLATDLQASAWGDAPVSPGKAPLEVVDVGLAAPHNRWIEEVEEIDGGIAVDLGASGGSGEGSKTTLTAAVGESTRLTAFVDDHRAVFHFAPPAGLYRGEARVEPGGDLAADDRLPFVGRTRGRVRVLWVNGDPRGFEIRDELLFVRRALAPSSRLGRAFQVDEVRLGELQESALAEADVVWLANPGPLSPELTRLLAARVEEGAGLVVSAGDRWTPEDLPGLTLGGLLPAPLRDVIAIPPDDPSRRPFEPLDTGSLSGPVEPFRDPAAGDLSATQVRTYWALDLRRGEGPFVWMRLENGMPLLVEGRRGRGRVLFLATTVDRDGADLCLQPGFVPWLERVLLHAAGRLRPELPRWAVAGVPFPLPYEEPVEVEGPDGRRRPWQPGPAPFVPPVPGSYTVWRDGAPLDGFTARIPPEESDLTPLGPEELARRLGEATFTLGRAGRGSSGGAGLPGRRDASRAVAAGLLACLAAEALLSARWRRRRVGPILDEGGAGR